MKKIVTIFLVMVLIFSTLQGITIFAMKTVYEQDFESNRQGWYSPWNGTVSITTDQAFHTSKRSLKISGRTQSWDSPAFNMYNVIRNEGPGTYRVSVRIMTDKIDSSCDYTRLIIRGNSENSFISERSNNNFYYALTPTAVLAENEWKNFVGTFSVESSDIINETGLFNLCIDLLAPATDQNIYFDNVLITKLTADDNTFTLLYEKNVLNTNESFVIEHNRTANVTYSSTAEHIATVSSQGIVTAVAPGVATIIANYANSEIALCDVYVTLKDGAYFFKNTALNNFLQTDDNGELRMEAWDYDGALDQQWLINYKENGYYTIQSKKDFGENDNKVITATNVEDENLALQNLVSSTTTTDTQLWRIQTLENGNCSIVAKSSVDTYDGLCMAVGDSTFEGITNGRNIEARDYESIDDGKGDWKIFSTSVPYWYSLNDEYTTDGDNDTIGYRNEEVVKIYYENLEAVDNYFFEDSVLDAVAEWDAVMPFAIQFTQSKSNADVIIYGLSRPRAVNEFPKFFNKNNTTNIEEIINSLANTYGVAMYSDLPHQYKEIFYLKHSSETTETKKVYEMPTTHVFIFDDIFDADSKRAIVLHELGHAFGYRGHLETGIMYHEPQEGVYHLTDYDLQILNYVYGMFWEGA